jgi:non-ribosomal peptide synthetase component F
MRLDPELVAAVQAYARSRGVTLLGVFLAGLAAALAEKAGAESLTVTTPFANRRPETADVVGCFAHALILRVDVAGAPEFDELVDRVRATLLEALAHGDLPAARILHELGSRRYGGHTTGLTTFFDVVRPSAPPAFEGLQAEHVEIATSGHFDKLLATVVEDADGWHVAAAFNVERIAPSVVDDLLADWVDRLASGVGVLEPVSK